MFHFIVNEIYRVEGCYMVMDADGLFDISDYSRMDEKKVSDIIDYCAELGLFNKELWQDKQILTSEEIQELYVGICKAIHRKPGIPESILLLETEPSPESATIPHATCEQQDTPAHECGSPASLPEDGKEIRQAVTRIRTLFAAEKELREEADKTRENKPYKIKYPPQPLRHKPPVKGRRMRTGILFRESSSIWEWTSIIPAGYTGFRPVIPNSRSERRSRISCRVIST